MTNSEHQTSVFWEKFSYFPGTLRLACLWHGPFTLAEQVTPLTPRTVHVSRIKQYYPGDEQPLDSVILKSEPEETHNDNIVFSESEGSDSAIVNTMPEDPAESEKSSWIPR